MVNLLGATYDQYLKAGVSVLICGSSAPSEDKLRFARENRIPAVTANWIWASIDAGQTVPFRDFLFGKLSPAGDESGDTFTSGSHETVQTMSMPTAPLQQKQTER
jgi:DNA replication regulator DPB11